MKRNTGALYAAGLVAVGIASAAVTSRLAAPAAEATFFACQNADGAIQPNTITTGMRPSCRKPGSRVTFWNRQGVRGHTGEMGPPGPAGTRGAAGPQGPAGPGLRIWRDAHGQVVGPSFPEAGSGEGRVLITYAGLRVLTPVFANMAPWGTATFENPAAVEELPTEYYETADCTGTAYFSIDRVLYLTLGTDVPSVKAINDKGQLYLLLMDPTNVRQGRLVRCYKREQIFPLDGPGANLSLSSNAIYVTPPLSTLYPGPLTLR